MISDKDLLAQNPSNSYNLPVISETYDKNFMICWQNGKIPNIYYQKFNRHSSTNTKLGNETILQFQNVNSNGIKQINPSIGLQINRK